ncbi:Uncharacterised protein [Mycobacterium tuberculosis]|nr:Uncharacterised protein [Mycobacterium tuberculosis]
MKPTTVTETAQRNTWVSDSAYARTIGAAMLWGS